MKFRNGFTSLMFLKPLLHRLYICIQHEGGLTVKNSPRECYIFFYFRVWLFQLDFPDTGYKRIFKTQ